MIGPGASVLLGYSLDLFAGEPSEAWHPVCWMGKIVDLADWAMPGRERSGPKQRLAGAVVATTLPIATYLGTRKVIRILPQPFSGLAEIVLMSTALAPRALYERALRVEDSLFMSVAEGREQVAGMVGRDTKELDEDGIVRAAVESIAENANDGVMAPLFYGLIGGAPLALAYKMVNTMDSMIGYRDLKYLYFGWAAARLDDAAGFIPARLTALAVAAVSPVAGGNAAGAISVWHRDAGLHESPNAGVCEAAYAGALDVRLGGDAYYSGTLVEKVELGAGLALPEREDISRAARLMYASSALLLALGIIFRMVVWICRWRMARRGGRG
ncbi:MAG: adenosylcobinamide-phosphate synthase CbiB [Thermoleophilia bacterium]|nr:adenosylcobinamide-phosphate synthase CbiB [Thermoleophilia bacterium]